MQQSLLKAGEQIEDLQNGYAIIQNPAYFSFGTDAVLLSHFASMQTKGRVVDLGTGCGIIPILLYARCPGLSITGIEVQPELAGMAARSVQLNALDEHIRIVCGDLKHALKFEKHGVDMVVTNPPYEKAEAGAHNADCYKNIAKREVLCTLSDVIGAAAALLRTGGRLCMIYRTERFAELMAQMREKRIEPKRIQLVASRHGQAPGFALVEGRKGAREGLKFLPTLQIYEQDGSYTAPLKQIYGIGDTQACSTSSQRR